MLQVKHQRGTDGKQFAYFVDPKDNRTYSKIIAGVSWPAEKNGYLVVLGRERITVEGRYQLRTLFEIDAPSVFRLYRACSVSKPFYQVSNFYGDTRNRPMQQTWASLNDIKLSTDQIWLCEAPHVREKETNWRAYLETLDLVLSEPKRLFLGDCRDIKSQIAMLPEDVAAKGIKDFPGVTALAYAVAAMELIE